MAHCQGRSHQDAIIGYLKVQCTTKMGEHRKLKDQREGDVELCLHPRLPLSCVERITERISQNIGLLNFCK